MDACGITFIKYTLFLFNLLFALSGLAVLIIGAIVLANIAQFGQFVDSTTLAPPIVLIVLGSTIFFIAFLGCCGALKENYYMLVAFAVFLGIVFVVELAVGIAASISKSEFTGAMRSSLRSSMANYTKSRVERKTWDEMQTALSCCGVDGPRGWSSIVGDNKVPASCCKKKPLESTDDPPTCALSSDTQEVQQMGCYEKVKTKVKDNVVIIMGVGLGITFVELAGIVLACCLAASVKKDQEVK